MLLLMWKQDKIWLLLLILRQMSNNFNIHYKRQLLYNIMATLLASPFTVDICCCGPLIICLILLFTQERYGTIVDPLGSLNNLMMLKRQRRVSPDQNTSRNTCRDPQGRELTAALTMGRNTPHRALKFTREHTQERNLIAVVNVGRDMLHLAHWLYTIENTQERNLIAVINVGRVLVNLEIWQCTREYTQEINLVL